jgi:hypothetical protein
VGVDVLAAAAAADVVDRGLVIDACGLGDDEGVADEKVVVVWVAVESLLW